MSLKFILSHVSFVWLYQFENGFKHGEGKDLNAMGKVVYEGKYFRGKAGDGSDGSDETEGQASSAEETQATQQQNSAHMQHFQRPGSLAQPSQQSAGDGSYWIDDDGDGVASDMQAPPSAPHTVAEDEPPCEAVVDKGITDCQGNEGRFTGLVLVSTKRPHGVGRLVYSDGKRIHEGFWVNGSKEGHGRCL